MHLATLFAAALRPDDWPGDIDDSVPAALRALPHGGRTMIANVVLIPGAVFAAATWTRGACCTGC